MSAGAFWASTAAAAVLTAALAGCAAHGEGYQWQCGIGYFDQDGAYGANVVIIHTGAKPLTIHKIAVTLLDADYSRVASVKLTPGNTAGLPAHFSPGRGSMTFSYDRGRADSVNWSVCQVDRIS